MLDEQTTTTETPSTTAKIAQSARLDDKAGKAIRLEAAKLLKGRYKDNLKNFAKALGMSLAGIDNILKGHSNGSLESAHKIAGLAGVPLASLVGEPLAMLAKSKVEKEKRARQTQQRERQPAPPPPVPRATAVNGARVGEPVDDAPLTQAELADLARGHVNAAAAAKLVAAYHAQESRIAKLQAWVLGKVVPGL